MIDLPSLAAWMSERGLGDGPIRELRRLPGGTQNVLLAFASGGEEFVLRYSIASPDGSSILREARVLGALGATDVPHPRLHGVEPDAAVLGVVFLLMARVDGCAPAAGPVGDGSVVAAELARGLAELGNLDPAELGLAGFGRPDGFLERQVPRWRSQFERYEQVAGYTACLPERSGIERWLERNRPVPQPAGVVHGDVHLSNVLFTAAPPRLAALLDWELATTGDPLLDLGQLLVGWPDPAGRSLLGARGSAAGLPAAATVLSEYAAASRRDVSQAGWYQVLACYRLAAIIEGSTARAAAGREPTAQARLFHAEAVRLLDRAQELVDGFG